MNVIHIWIYCLNIDFYYSYQMHTHPEQVKQREKHTRYPLKLFFFFLLTKRGNKDRKKVKKTSSTMNTEGKKSIGQIVSSKSQDKKQYPYFK